MRAVENMDPAEFVDHMWSNFDRFSPSGSDYRRWRDPKAVAELDAPHDKFLSAEELAGRRQAMAAATRDCQGMEELWRAIVAKPLRHAMAPQDVTRCGALHVALFPSYSIDAKLTFTPRGDRLVLIHAAMGPFLARLSSPFAKLLVGGRLRPDEQLSLASDLRALWDGTIHHVSVPPESGPHALVQAHLSRAAEQFIVGHEYGHAALGHAAYTQNEEANHTMEYEADQYGATLMFRALAMGIDSEHPAGRSESTECYGVLAPCMVLGGFSLIGAGRSLTHPGPLDRMMTFVEKYQSLLPAQHTWTARHLQLVLRNMVGVAKCFYKWADGETF